MAVRNYDAEYYKIYFQGKVYILGIDNETEIWFYLGKN